MNETIWIASSDAETRRLININLKRRGFHIVEIASTSETLSNLADPDLFILDVDTANDKIWKSIESLRQNPKLMDVSWILLVTGAPGTSQISSLEPVRWMEKPLAIDVLLELVRESLSVLMDDEADLSSRVSNRPN